MSGSSVSDGTIRFHAFCMPPLDAGTYTLNSSQTVTELAGTGAGGAKGPLVLTSELGFTVTAPRFGLAPAEIYSVHPPKGQRGDFAELLPQVIFSSRTLPWDRTIDAKPRKAGDVTPWMALITLGPGDFDGTPPPDPQSRALSALLQPGSGVTGPALGSGALADGAEKGDLCMTLDLPATLFRQIAPRAAELSSLAHVREVDTGTKETSSLLADGWFSVIAANRMPEAAGTGDTACENHAYLVSLEGHAEHLEGGKSKATGALRLAVLAHWRFGCTRPAGTAAALAALVPGPLAVPFRRSGTGDEAYAEAALAMGFAAVNHATRAGERTVSWYRGPLVPLHLDKEEDLVFRPTADAALRYSPRDGMFDASYASAWQLGRLLALQDRHFVAALQRFRARTRRRINDRLGSTRAAGVLSQSAAADSEAALMRRYIGGLDAEAESPGPASWTAPEAELNSDETDEGGDTGTALRLTRDFDLKVPHEVSRWLARLVLLYRVPFAYLVPDERMLEPGRLANFSLDPNWLKCLLEGACSVGRSGARDELVDKFLRHRFLDFALEDALSVRGGGPAAEGDGTPVASAPKARPNWPLSGFVLRSPLVAGWRGLEMRAWSDDAGTDLLAPLRIDRLAPDIMLCIFNGPIARIELKEPPEGLHFGLTREMSATGEARYRKLILRQVSKTGPGKPGAQLPNKGPVTANQRPGAVRVLDIAGLSGDLARELGLGKEMTSAHLAVQLVNSASRLVLDRHGGAVA